MRADGTTFRLRCTSGSVETEDLDGREELTGVPHIDEVDVETYLIRPPGAMRIISAI